MPNSTEIDSRLILAVDAGSPIVSTALARDGRILAGSQSPGRKSSQDLIHMIDALLAEADSRVSDLQGILALRGPGSFTGLRVGLATCLGLHQALGVPATTLTTLETLASLSQERNQVVLAAVESIRESWLVQAFRSDVVPAPLTEPRSVSTAELVTAGADLFIGFGLREITDPERPGFHDQVLVPPPLAAPALSLLARRHSAEWSPAGLVQPLYLQAPAAKPSTARPQ
jgi:tRNA threonylcarbamoyl adenosine modification protein YeaZ